MREHVAEADAARLDDSLVEEPAVVLLTTSSIGLVAHP
jgi:hypothetical protein